MPTLTKQVHAGNQTYEGLVRGLGPVGYWRLNEASGTVAHDLSGNGNDGTYVNAPTLGAGGLIARDSAKSAQFNGTDEYVTLGKPADLVFTLRTDPFSVCAWLDTADVTGYVVCKGDGTTGVEYGLLIVSSVFRIIVGGTSSIVGDVSSLLSGGDPFFLSMTVPAAWSEAAGYINGSLMADSPPVGTDTVDVDTLIGARRGDGNSGHGALLAGSVQEVMIFDKVLSAAEVNLLYLARKNGV